MNTADKSISLVDSALRRRFSFIEIFINPSLIQDAFVRDVFNLINEGIEKENANLRDLLIGHAYLMNVDKLSLEPVLNQQIIPLLYEYFYDNVTKVEAVLNALQTLNITIQRHPYQRLTVKV
jgi:5-methylcytosine-specific restriction endonuclease McrBC GTP-binding regulatory subunit McrB